MSKNDSDSCSIGHQSADFHDLTFFKFVLQNLPVAVLTVNSDLKITCFNTLASDLTGYSFEEAKDQYCGEILRGGMCSRNCPLKRAINREHPVVQVDTTIQNRRGETIPIRMSTAALTDDEGRLVGAVEAFQDISLIKSMEREKDNLISMFAHDMKSSLTIIGGFTLRLLKKRADLDAKKRDGYLRIIREETGKLDFLVDDFLEFARLQTGKLKLEFQATSLDKELIELFDAYQSRAMQSGIKLELRDEAILPVMEADPRRLRRVFTNLLDNALKFSLPGGTITISTAQTAEEIMITIKDEGEGIDPQDLPFIFDIFRRGKRARGKDGSGVGLATVKAIVEGHGGRVSVESAPGKGAAFTVILPKFNKEGDQQAEESPD